MESRLKDFLNKAVQTAECNAAHAEDDAGKKFNEGAMMAYLSVLLLISQMEGKTAEEEDDGK